MRQHFADNTIFANNATEIDAPDVDIYARAYESGSGKIPPSAGVHNNLFNRSDQQHQHVEQNGIPVWDARTSYDLNGLALSDDAAVYQSLYNDNVNARPQDNIGTKWRFFCSADAWDDIRNRMLAAEKGIRDNADGIRANANGIKNINDLLPDLMKQVQDAAFEVLKTIFPIKSVAFRTVNPGLPTSQGGFGFGTWVEKSGRSPIGAGTFTDKNNETKSFGEGSDYGEFDHRLTESQLPSHRHRMFNSDFSAYTPITDNKGFYLAAGGGHPTDTYYQMCGTSKAPTLGWNGNTGGNQGHNNIHPTFGCKIWYRIA